MKSLPTLLLLSMFWMAGAQGQTVPESPELASLRKAARSAQFTAKKPAEAIELWSQLLQQQPDDNQALRLRGSAYAELGEHAKALADHTRATKLEPNNGNAWGGLCWGRILANRPLEARPACEKGVALNTNTMAITVNLGHTWLLAGDTKTAQAWYQKTLPLIDSESDLKEGPLADFDLFIERGWQVEASRQARQWFAEKGPVWLARKAPADSLLKQAQDAEKGGDEARAIALYQERLPLLEGLYGADDLRVILAANRIGGLRAAAGRHADAEPLYRRTLAISEKVHGPEHPNVGTDLNNLALLLQTTGRYAEAEPLYRRALAIAEKALGPEHPHVGTYLRNLAELLNTTGRYADAEPLYRRALAIAEKAHGPEHPDVGTYLNNLATLLDTTGRYAEAEPLYRRALAIAEKVHGPEHPTFGTYLNNLAGLLTTTGRYAEAEPLFRRALAIGEKAHGPEHPDVGIHLSKLAGLLTTTGRYAEAEPLYRRALAIGEKAHGPEHPHVGIHLNNLALLLLTTGRYAEAEPLYRRALAIAEKALGPEHPHTGADLTNLAGLLTTTGRYAESEPLYLRAWRIARSAGMPELAWKTQGHLMIHYRELATPQPGLAIFYGKQAINTLQTVRGNLKTLDESTQKSFLDTVEKTYQTLADLLIGEGRLAEAQQVLAMLKEEEFHGFIQRDAGADGRSTQASYTGPEIVWAQRYAEIGERLASLGKEAAVLKKMRSRSADDEKRLQQLDADLVVANQAFDAAITEITAAFADTKTRDLLRRDIEAKSSAFKSILKELGHDAVLAQYIVLPDKVRILLTTPHIVIAREAAIGEKDLNAKVAAYRSTLSNRSLDPRPQARELYELLIGPLADDLKQAGAKTLMLSLDGTLRYLPFAALHDGHGYLAERLSLPLYTEAARDKLLIKPKADWEIWGLGLTEAKAGFNPLAGVRRELESIIGQDGLAGDIRLDARFDRKAMKEGLDKEYPILHLASHFKFTPGNETDSFLVLGTGDKLSLADIRHGFEFGSVELLTLSACETAMGGGRDARGVEVEGLGVVAQNKGAKGVLATLWPVADDSTALLMQTFYKLRTEQKLTKAEALRQAQLSLMGTKVGAGGTAERGRLRTAAGQQAATFVADPSAPFAHPYYWAPFILMGNWL